MGYLLYTPRRMIKSSYPILFRECAQILLPTEAYFCIRKYQAGGLNLNAGHFAQLSNSSLDSPELTFCSSDAKLL